MKKNKIIKIIKIKVIKKENIKIKVILFFPKKLKHFFFQDFLQDLKNIKKIV